MWLLKVLALVYDLKSVCDLTLVYDLAHQTNVWFGLYVVVFHRWCTLKLDLFLVLYHMDFAWAGLNRTICN